MNNKLKVVGVFLISFVLVFGITYYVNSSNIQTLKYCEEQGWDGSEYNTGVKSLDIGENFGEYIVVKCNKDESTDALIAVYDSFFFWEGIKK